MILPGLPHGLARGRRPIELEFLGVGSSSQSTSVSYPVPPQDGDIAVMLDFARISSDPGPGAAPSTVVPSGFTSRFNQTCGYFTGLSEQHFSGRGIISTRICDGDEGASVSGMDDNGFTGAQILRRKRLALFRPSRGVSIGTTLSDGFSGTSNTSTKMAVSVSQPASAPQLLVAGFMFNQNTTRSVDASPAFSNLSSGNSIAAGYAIVPKTADLTPVSAELNSSANGPIVAGLVALSLA